MTDIVKRLSQNVYQLKSHIENIDKTIEKIKNEINNFRDQATSLSNGLRESQENNLPTLLVFCSMFFVAKTVTYFSMRLFLRLEDESKSCAIWVDYFLVAPLEQDYDDVSVQETYNRDKKIWEIQIR